MKIFILIFTFLNFLNFYSQNKKSENLILKRDNKTSKFAYYNSRNEKILGDYWYAKDKFLKRYAIVSDPSPVLIDRNGKHIYDIFIFDNGPDYENDGLIRIVKNGKIGFINSKTYNLVIKPQFECAYPFINGKSKVAYNCKTRKNGEYSTWISEYWFYINKNGQKIKN